MLLLPSALIATGLIGRRTIDSLISFLLADPPPALLYPTQFTQGIVPKAIHSHNDYWRTVPLLTALAVGATSTEADLWLVDGELLVGHSRSSLTRNRTFASLYIDPLVEILTLQNPNSLFGDVSNSRPSGIFDTADEQTLQLLIDYKTNGTLLHPYVLAALEPLRSHGWLTTFSALTNTTTVGPITAIGTGSTPLSLVKAQEPRDLFFDAPLADLRDADYGAEVAPLASASLRAAIGWQGLFPISPSAATKLREQVGLAHERGMKVRYWDTTEWPMFARNRIWQTLLEFGADYINADDVLAASQY